MEYGYVSEDSVRPVYTLKPPATAGAFYCFNYPQNPTNQPLMPGTKLYLAPPRAGFFIAAGKALGSCPQPMTLDTHR